ncbi:MAG: UDP-N-acetylmuramoyl-tripeptide--D-alanyl-D-alanine ligase [Clostridia bacterium]|nr:UDP-N-acetylmuramoyl-tripeptide--D-alanyl-D-alanine ligase [Clostridia bacterium]
MEKIIGIVIIAVTALLLTLVGRRIFLIYQLSSYRARGVMNWLKITRFDYAVRYFALAFLGFISTFVYVACFYKYLYVRYLGYLVFVGLCVLFLVLTGKEKNKVPLKFTARMVRFHIVAFLLYLGFATGLYYLVSLFSVKLSYSVLTLLPITVPIIVTAAHFIALPFETLNNYSYKVRAKAKLDSMPEMIRIGITGSYGKTTAKVMLAQMLQKKYRVCFSQKSYNTPMGICKVVNNDLPDDSQVFVAEMGARFKGDIEELTKIVKPNYGIITAIGNQHLETFGSLKNIMDTKFELVENLCTGGMSFFNGDSKPNVELFERAKESKQITGGEDVQNAAVTYKNVEQTTDGVRFTLVFKSGEYDVRTKLLGRHIPSLIAVCAAVAFELGVTPQDIVETCEAIEPVPHRLELMKSGEMVIIDDAYNANVEGAENALLALAGFEDRTRVIITPGLVELGKEEKQANIDLGEKIGKYCDVAFLLGARAQQLKEGALKGGMQEENIKIVQTVAEAVEQLRALEGKTAVLFENDLPDNY